MSWVWKRRNLSTLVLYCQSKSTIMLNNHPKICSCPLRNKMSVCPWHRTCLRVCGWKNKKRKQSGLLTPLCLGLRQQVDKKAMWKAVTKNGVLADQIRLNSKEPNIQWHFLRCLWRLKRKGVDKGTCYQSTLFLLGATNAMNSFTHYLTN